MLSYRTIFLVNDFWKKKKKKKTILIQIFIYPQNFNDKTYECFETLS